MADMTKAELLATLAAEFAKLEEYVAAVGQDRMAIGGVSGMYSMADLIAHLEAYSRALVTWLAEAQAGRVYVDPVVDLPDLDARNAAIYEANKERGAAEVLARYRQTWDALLRRVESLTEDQLTNEELAAWFVVPRWQRKQPLWKCIANDTYEHHQQHWPDLDSWLAEHPRSTGGLDTPLRQGASSH
jgi:hypothetical protein